MTRPDVVYFILEYLLRAAGLNKEFSCSFGIKVFLMECTYEGHPFQLVPSE